MLAAGYVLHLKASTLSGDVPLPPALLFHALANHSEDVADLASFSLNVWLTRSLYLFGDAGPFIPLVLAGVGLVLRGRVHSTLIWNFGWMAGLGFGVLFFVLTDDHPTSRFFDQSYLLVPVVCMVSSLLETLRRAMPTQSRFVLGMAWLLSLGTLLGGLTFVWHLPTSFFPSRLMISETVDIGGDVIGIRRPEYGHKAAGYLVRQELLAAWTARPGVPLWVHHHSRLNQKGYDPFFAYAGLYQKGDWFADRLGFVPPITYARSVDGEACDGFKTCLVVSGSVDNRIISEDAGMDMNDCPALHCVDMRFGDGAGDALLYDIRSGDKTVYRIRTWGLNHPAFAPGSYQVMVFNHAMEQDYSHLKDLLPPRARYRINAIAQKIGSVMGR
ncbi:MAG: hypothetical protein JXQ84_00965 [Rhodospirillaceae bacterium]|nr:hypothetical protein [Rhodospirillaceae bacterium]